MRRFVFSLQGILQVRTAQHEARAQELLQARLRLRREEAAMQRLEEQFRTALAAVPVGAGAGYFLQRERYLAWLKRSMQEQRVKVGAAETAVTAAVGRLRLADIELRKMEKLQERERKHWQREFQRLEQQFNDEIGSSRAFYRRQPK
ncbi:MAG: flagellar export protein FliJ [Victivallales bacterium]|nr:flagellar export protein FliJ [Victivallales bacterium]